MFLSGLWGLTHCWCLRWTLEELQLFLPHWLHLSGFDVWFCRAHSCAFCCSNELWSLVFWMICQIVGANKSHSAARISPQHTLAEAGTRLSASSEEFHFLSKGG